LSHLRPPSDEHMKELQRIATLCDAPSSGARPPRPCVRY
jgi:hypothetical protein